MANIDDTSYQRILGNAWELRQTILKLAASLQDPAYSRNDKEDLEIARKAAVAAVRDVHLDLRKMGAEAPFFTWAMTESPLPTGVAGPPREVLRQEVF